MDPKTKATKVSLCAEQLTFLEITDRLHRLNIAICLKTMKRTYAKYQPKQNGVTEPQKRQSAKPAICTHKGDYNRSQEI
ncbi:hypothetical protein RvY_13394 [Ramazzottius varieornatus]|uniref:Uncharacterized protein n=1 Tax=Ramazzottius varieornatus TaxID=947166 RepID=A0A1D1VMR4_RAMVA|nr:hypothetical protein RvY_13394 [Ramazzottius varieornatus]